MNILFLVSSMGPGGAERVAATLANSWISRGYRVTLVVTYSNRGDCAYHLSPGVELIYLADRTQASTSKVLSKMTRLYSLRKLIISKTPDTIVSFLTNVNVAAIVASIGLTARVVVSERSYPPQVPIGKSLYFLRRITYPFATCVVMLTTKGMQWVKSNIDANQVTVIPNPVIYPLIDNTPTRLTTDYFPDDRKILLAVGRLAPEKQLDHLIRVFSSIAAIHPDWDLAIVGEGPLLHNLMEMVASLRLSNRVKMIGRVGNIGDWYIRADLFVLCSKFEGFPNTLIEAMAYGCAAVSYDCDTGPRDIIKSGTNGILITPGQTQDLTNTISNLMFDEVERHRMGEAAKSVREQFALPNILDQWDATFRD